MRFGCNDRFNTELSKVDYDFNKVHYNTDCQFGF